MEEERAHPIRSSMIDAREKGNGARKTTRVNRARVTFVDEAAELRRVLKLGLM